MKTKIVHWGFCERAKENLAFCKEGRSEGGEGCLEINKKLRRQVKWRTKEYYI
ncbi:unnamed protein product [Callosobruchus maculatus]|uniref:Uncharacterized protein n=1 Tax=Callosobruchus maculatus TaxID=64391 RepID=A0A653CVQ7_CALMS|nr:unnamed protein product [Callosobruchus maculatus]